MSAAGGDNPKGLQHIWTNLRPTDDSETCFMIEALLDVVERAMTVDPADVRSCFQLAGDYEAACAPDDAPLPLMTAARALDRVDLLTRGQKEFAYFRTIFEQLKVQPKLSSDAFLERMRMALISPANTPSRRTLLGEDERQGHTRS